MKIKCLSILLIVFLFSSLTSSAQSWLWGVEGITGLKADLYARNVATNGTGNVYHTGDFSTSLTFGTYNLTSSGIDDAYLVKYDSSGNVLWAVQSQSPPGSKTFSRSVATDDSDNSYITGYTGDTTIFGTDTITNKSQGFLVKYDAGGNIKWVRQAPFNPINKSGGYDVTTDHFGHEYLTGAGAYLIKYDRNGNIVWTIPQTTHYYLAFDSLNNAGFSVAADNFGNVYMAGEFSDTLQFGNYTLYSNTIGAFVAKFDSNGNVLWAQQSLHMPDLTIYFNQSYYKTQTPNYALAVDPAGNVYFTSTFYDSIQFGSHLFTSINSFIDTLTFNFFVLKFNPSGSVAWGEQAAMLTPTDTNGWGSYSICADDSYHIYISGTKSQEEGVRPYTFILRNDTVTVRSNGYDAPTFLLKLDTTGYVLCNSVLESGGFEDNAVTCDPTGKYVYVGGGFQYPFKVGNDSLTVTEPGYEPFVARWQSCANCNTTISAPTQSVCYGHDITLQASGGSGNVTYTWSPTLTLNTSTGESVSASPTTTTTYTVTASGGDCNDIPSQIILNVIPSPNKPSIRQDGDTLISSAKYDNQWYRNDTLLVGDTSRYLIITILGEYLVNVLNEANGCSTSSDSVDILSLTGINQLSIINKQLLIYPNPTSNQLTVESGQLIVNEITITNVLGQIIYKSVISPDTNTNPNTVIDLSYLPGGLYFITINSNPEMRTQKFVKL